jgi:hypothetical protein
MRRAAMFAKRGAARRIYVTRSKRHPLIASRGVDRERVSVRTSRANLSF